MRPKRTAALKSEDKVRSLAKKIIDDGDMEAEENNDSEQSDSESLELSSPPSSGPDDTIDKLIASPPRRGRPRKDSMNPSRGQKSATPSTGAKYKKIGDFTPVKPSIYPLIRWGESLEGARMIKRSSKGRNKLAENDSKFIIPPVDLLAICSEHIEYNKHATTKSIRATLHKDSFNHEHTIALNVDSYGRSKHQLRIDTGKMESIDTKDDLIYCLNASTSPSDGGVAAMDWACLNESSVLMVCSTLPSASYANTVIPSDESHKSGNNSAMIQLWELSMTGDLGASFIRTHAIMGGDCVKNVALCQADADANSFIIAAIASDGRLNLCQYQNGIVSNIACFEDDSFSAVSLLHSEESVYVAAGTTTGDLYLYNVISSNEASIKRVASVKLSSKPIISIAFTADNPYLMAIGIHDSPSHLVDVRCSDGGSYPLQSSLSYTPLVRWAGVGTKGWIIADTEQSCRFYPASTLADRHSVPLASFPSAVNGVATSPLHNIIATSGADGHVHLTWLSPDDDPTVQIEKDILTFNDGDTAHINLTTHLKVPKGATGKTDLGTPSQWIHGLSWCPSFAAPGLLALTSAHHPLIIFISIDRLAIL